MLSYLLVLNKKTIPVLEWCFWSEKLAAGKWFIPIYKWTKEVISTGMVFYLRSKKESIQCHQCRYLGNQTCYSLEQWFCSVAVPGKRLHLHTGNPVKAKPIYVGVFGIRLGIGTTAGGSSRHLPYLPGWRLKVIWQKTRWYRKFHVLKDEAATAGIRWKRHCAKLRQNMKWSPNGSPDSKCR